MRADAPLSGRPSLVCLLLAAASLPGAAVASAQPTPVCEGDGPHGWDGVAVSRQDADTVAAWTQERLWVSRDGGSRWTLALSLTTGWVQQVVVLPGGSLAVLAGEPSRLVLVRRGASPLVREVPFESPAMAGGGGTLILTAEEGFATSRDAGRTWHRVQVPFGGTAYGPSGQPFVELDGTVRVLDVEVNTCTSVDVLEWLRVHVVAPGEVRAEIRELDIERMGGATTFAFGAHGSLYSWSRPDLLAVGPRGARPVRGWAPTASPVRCPLAQGSLGAYLTCPPATPEELAELRRQLVVGSNGRITLALLGSSLVRLEGEHASLLSDGAPEAVGLEVDARGRPWVLTARGAIVRFSRRGGWTQLLPGCDG